MTRAEFAIALNADGTGTVRLGGEEVPGVVAVRVDGIADRTPLVTLQVRADVELEGVGVIEAPAATSEAATEELLGILDAIDEERLDKDVLEGLGLGDGGSTAGAYLAAIRRYVRGD